METSGIVKRIGYACKTMFPDDPETTKRYNFRSTTLAHITKLSEEERNTKIQEIVLHNLRALSNVLHLLDRGPMGRRMFRIGSDFLPLWDHPIAGPAYAILEDTLPRSLEYLGRYARASRIRLSFHPDQFVVIASPNPDVATRGIATLESVAEIARMMGYTGWHPHGFAINIHAGAASVTREDLRDAIENRLSEQARNLLTLENDEFSHSLEWLCELSDIVAIVPDLHHYWIHHGFHCAADNPNLQGVIESWRGTRPKLHLAMSRQHLIPEGQYVLGPRALSALLETGLTKSKLRAHSDTPWHIPTLNYAYQFWDDFDIMWEGKDKNLGQEIIYNHFTNNQND